METWRFVNLGKKSPVYSISISEALLTAIKEDKAPNTLCLVIPERFVWLGLRGNLYKRVNIEFCKRSRIPIVRGFFGGGSAVFDNDQILWNIVAKERIETNKVFEWVVESLTMLGFNAYHRKGKNDVLINGKKICGTGYKYRDGVALAIGDIIVDFNYELCKRALPLNLPEFREKEVKTHAEWITTLKQIRSDITFDEVADALRNGFEKVFKISFEEQANSLTPYEEEIMKGLKEKYSSDLWTKFRRWCPVKDSWRPT